MRDFPALERIISQFGYAVMTLVEFTEDRPAAVRLMAGIGQERPSPISISFARVKAVTGQLRVIDVRILAEQVLEVQSIADRNL
jgi:hypothetical protein